MNLTLGRACALSFVVAFAALYLQVLVHRIISAKLLNDYAFLVISLTMLGFAAAGAVLSVVQRFVQRRLASALTVAAALATLAGLWATTAFYGTHTQAAFLPSRPALVRAFLDWAPFALLFALPFAGLAFILGALLSARHLDLRRVYFADLLGSALGAVVVLPSIRHLGVETSLVACLALLPLATLVIVKADSRGARAAALAASVAALLVGAHPSLLQLQPAKGSPGDFLRTAQSTNEEYIRWDPLARVELSPIEPPDPTVANYPSLLGNNRKFLSHFQKMLTQNNYAYAYAVRYDGDPASFVGVEETLYAAGYIPRAAPPGRVVAIGVGGGFDILTALRFGAGQVTGVEVNATILRLLTTDRRDYFRPWVEDPRVRLVHDEGRHFLATSEERPDLIQLSGVDSYSGTPGAAHVFSENYLYTREAFELYLARLADDGILHMMRLEHTPPREMLRALVTAVAALRAHGVTEPRRHVVTLGATRGNITSLLLKRRPFTAEELARLRAWTGQSPHFAISSAPDETGPPQNAYQGFLAEAAAGRERLYTAAYPFDISPTEDDRPFFFRTSRWWHLFPADALIWRSVPVMEMNLILLLVSVGLAAFVFVGLPLRQLRRGHRPAGLWRIGLYFTCIGLGFMAVEMALLQRFGLLLGHPSYTLSVVLAALLLGSGLGALYSREIVARLRGVRFAAYALSGLLLAQFLLVPKPAQLVSQPFAVRTALVVVLTASAGFLMGIFFPLGLDRLKDRAAGYVPWAWGLNGVASVLAPILSIGIAITLGNTFLLVASLPLYLLAGFLLPGERAAA